MIFFYRAAEGVEEAVLDVALQLKRVEEVGALGLSIERGVGIEESASLVLVAEAEEGRDAVGEGVVGLVVELVAVGDGVAGGKDEGGLAGGSVAVGSADGDWVAVVGGLGCAVYFGGDGLACGRELLDLLSLANDAVADEGVKVPCYLIFDGEAGVDVLIGLLAGGGDAVDVVGARQA